MTRRIVIKDINGLYGICGLIQSDQLARERVDDGQGMQFRLVAVRERYILYVPDVVEMQPEPVMPNAWKPFVEHGVSTWPAPR